MKIQLLRDISKLFFLTAGFYLLHFSVFRLGHFEEINLLSIYLFMFGLTALAYIVIRLAHKNNNKQTIFIFLGFSTIKMAAVVICLLLVAKPITEGGRSFILQFFTVYFLYLFLEATFVLKLFNSKRFKRDKTISKNTSPS